MIRKVFFIGTFILSFVIASCGNSNKANEVKETKSENSSVPEAGKPEYLTYNTFIDKVWDFENSPKEWKYKGKLPAIIDFYADWCGPCKRIAPIMEKIAKEYEGKLVVYKIDTDKQKELASVFQIQSLPSVLFVPVDGQPMMQIGALPEAEYYKVVKEQLLKEN
ncbi:MAG: thioredoxin [Hyphomicrobiales bacterium]